MAVVPYMPTTGVPAVARAIFQPWAFALMRKVPTWWDETQPQPTHWKHAN